ncbi:putative nuclease HARBI1 [Harmonia axyridis]|uniref:putative nuclease HARBI1 n=1 Tax=Harmonia axyridis TaxID=115357 RepID=UPI001E27956C|nr:putative nuclease HARBI1 [Harmonia axyridis]
MPEETFHKLLELLRPKLTRQNTNMRESISPEERLIATLRYLATGCTFEDWKFSTRISPQCLGRIIPETCDAIYEILRKDYLKFPRTTDDYLKIAREFETRWNFPNCGGSINEKHVRIKKTANSGSYFYNYKKFFSVVLLAIVNANYEFIYVHTGTNERISDGGVIEKTKFFEKLKKNELNLPTREKNRGHLNYVFIGDEAFALTENVIKPYTAYNLDHDKRIFNYRLSRARRVVENAFGMLGSRFKIFHREINLSLEKLDKVILGCCVLHNFLRRNCGKETYTAVEMIYSEDIQTLSSLENLDCQNKNCTQTETQTAKKVRNEYKEYFNGIGKVPWQEAIISS